MPGPGQVSTARLETLEDEARHVVEWLGRRLARPERRTAAVLCRKRSQFDPVVEALEDAGIPYEVVGLGGLLHTPEVADIVALLHVVQDPTRGDRLMRLLTGPSCRLGAADLDGLAEWSRLRQRPGRGDRNADLSPDASERASIVEALDDLPPATWVGAEGQRLSAVALQRLAGLGEAVRRLRALTGLGLPELVAEAETALGLDIEVLSRPGYSPGAARAHLDAFADVGATFAASADRPTLGGFLAWLEAAVDEERGLDLGWVEARPDAVQVMTVHAAKGLEWDVVAVPGLVESSFPAHSANQGKVVGDGWGHADPSDKGWLVGLSTLPYDLRGDREGLPRFGWADDHDWDSAQEAFEVFTGALADHGITEERRLAYVAVTRARKDLLLTAHVWGAASTPRVTSRFLDEVRDAGGAGLAPGPWVDMPPVDDPKPQNPRTAEAVSITWPTLDHVDRRERLLEPARQVASLATDPAAAEPVARGRWDAEVRMLLDERARRRSGAPVDVALPPHLSTSALVALAEDAERFTLDLRRPMPTPPALAARRGTAFHAWVEEHYSRAAFVDVDDLPGSADDDADRHRPRRRCGPASWPASGPTARRSRSRRASRRSSTASRCAGGSTPSSRRSGPTARPAGWSSTGRPAPPPAAPGRRRARCSCRPTGWRGRGCAACRKTGCAVRSSTRPRARRSGPSCPGPTRSLRVLRAARPT